MKDKLPKIITLFLTGTAAYLSSDLIYEVIGHCLTALIIGQKIELLSSVFFCSKPGSIIIDLAGPISNLLFGLIVYYIIKNKKTLSLNIKILLFLLMSYNFFWFSGTIVESIFNKTGDWTYLMKQLNLGLWGGIILVSAGIIAYYLSIKLCKKIFKALIIDYSNFPFRQFIYYSYFGAMIAAAIAGVFFTPDRINAVQGGILEMLS